MIIMWENVINCSKHKTITFIIWKDNAIDLNWTNQLIVYIYIFFKCTLNLAKFKIKFKQMYYH